MGDRLGILGVVGCLVCCSLLARMFEMIALALQTCPKVLKNICQICPLGGSSGNAQIFLGFHFVLASRSVLPTDFSNKTTSFSATDSTVGLKFRYYVLVYNET